MQPPKGEVVVPSYELEVYAQVVSMDLLLEVFGAYVVDLLGLYTLSYHCKALCRKKNYSNCKYLWFFSVYLGLVKILCKIPASIP